MPPGAKDECVPAAAQDADKPQGAEAEDDIPQNADVRMPEGEDDECVPAAALDDEEPKDADAEDEPQDADTGDADVCAQTNPPKDADPLVPGVKTEVDADVRRKDESLNDGGRKLVKVRRRMKEETEVKDDCEAKNLWEELRKGAEKLKVQESEKKERRQRVTRRRENTDSEKERIEKKQKKGGKVLKDRMVKYNKMGGIKLYFLPTGTKCLPTQYQGQRGGGMESNQQQPVIDQPSPRTDDGWIGDPGSPGTDRIQAPGGRPS